MELEYVYYSLIGDELFTLPTPPPKLKGELVLEIRDEGKVIFELKNVYYVGEL